MDETEKAQQTFEELIADYFESLIRQSTYNRTEDRIIFLIVCVRCQLDMGGVDSIFDQVLHKEETLRFLIEAFHQLGERELADTFSEAYKTLEATGFFTDLDLMLFELTEDNPSLDSFLSTLATSLQQSNRLWELDEKLCRLLPTNTFGKICQD